MLKKKYCSIILIVLIYILIYSCNRQDNAINYISQNQWYGLTFNSLYEMVIDIDTRKKMMLRSKILYTYHDLRKLHKIIYKNAKHIEFEFFNHFYFYIQLVDRKMYLYINYDNSYEKKEFTFNYVKLKYILDDYAEILNTAPITE